MGNSPSKVLILLVFFLIGVLVVVLLIRGAAITSETRSNQITLVFVNTLDPQINDTQFSLTKEGEDINGELKKLNTMLNRAKATNIVEDPRSPWHFTISFVGETNLEALSIELQNLPIIFFAAPINPSPTLEY